MTKNVDMLKKTNFKRLDTQQVIKALAGGTERETERRKLSWIFDSKV